MDSDQMQERRYEFTYSLIQETLKNPKTPQTIPSEQNKGSISFVEKVYSERCTEMPWNKE